MLEITCGMIGNTLMMPGDVSSEVIIAIVNFMYTGSIKIENERYDELLKSSKDMKLTALTKLLEAHRPEPSNEPSTFKSEPDQVEAINLEPLDIPVKTELVDPLDDETEEIPSSSEDSAKPKKRRRKIKEFIKKKHLCSDCNKMFATKQELNFHIKSVHTNTCIVCHKIFYRQDEFDAHDLQACIRAVQTICNKCSKVFRSKAALDEHFQDKHSEENQGYTRKCSVEGKNFVVRD